MKVVETPYQPSEELAKVLEKPLDPAQKYYDATPSIEECAKALANLTASQQVQADINRKLIDALSDALVRIEILEGKAQGSALILPPRLDS